MESTKFNGHPVLRMAELGWRCITIPERQKGPKLTDWPSLASCDPVQIKNWINQYPNCNWGVLLGPSSGICDIEADSPEGGEILDSAIEDCGVRTPAYSSSRGVHRLFLHDERMAADSATIVKAGGIDWRFGDDAHQSVVPPSIHPSGAKYQWRPGLSPDDVEVARLPDSMWQLMLELRQRAADEKQKERETNRKTTPIVPCDGNHEIGVHTEHVKAAEALIEKEYSWHRLLFEFGWKECSETIFTRPGDDWSNYKSAELCLEGPGVPGLQVWTSAAPVDPGRYGKFRFWLHSKGYTDSQQLVAAKAFLGDDRSKQVDAAFFEVKTGTPEVDLDRILNAKTEAAVASSDGYIIANAIYPQWSVNLLSRTKPVRFALADESSGLSWVQAAPRRVIAIAGEPGVGKTMFVMQLLVDGLRLSDDLKVLVCNCEMDAETLMERQLARLSGVDLDLIQERTFEDEHVDRIQNGLQQLDSLSPRLAFLKPPFTVENVQKACVGFKPDIVCLDYVQRFSSGKEKDAISNINALMAFARNIADQGACVFVVSALSRGKDGSGRSSYAGSNNSASFRGSSELEYGCDDAFIMGHVPDSPARVVAKQVKSRNRECKNIDLIFHGAIQRFESIDVEGILSGGKPA